MSEVLDTRACPPSRTFHSYLIELKLNPHFGAVRGKRSPKICFSILVMHWQFKLPLGGKLRIATSWRNF
jgi:hypothetical protein